MKNILKEIKNDIISKGDEPNVDNLDQYISQDKIFCIFFYSKLIPDSSNILSSLKIINTFDALKLVICICEENEEDFKISLDQINNNSCIILKYESKNRDSFINAYNIISLPCMIILNKYGELMDMLNKERIQSLNEKDIEGWKNKFIVPNMYKNRLPELGDKTKISNHKHELVFSNNEMKGYGINGWICDICRKNFQYTVSNFFCALCGFDACDTCINKYRID